MTVARRISSRALRRLLIAVPLCQALACADTGHEGDEGGSDEGGSGESGSADTGTMQLTFTLGGAASGSSHLVDPPMGTVYGGIYLSADVGATGPRDDAVQQAFVEAPGIDLTTAMVSTASFTTDPLPGGESYTFLGFFDVDSSSAATEEKDPETGDPVTLPTANKVMVEAGQVAALEVHFDLVL